MACAYRHQTYLRSPIEHRSNEFISLPFHGGAKGQVLQIKRHPDGTVTSEIVKQNTQDMIKEHEDEKTSFRINLSNIQKAASELVQLQQNIKLTGKLNTSDKKVYAENLEKLGVSAQNLAHIQQHGGGDDFRLLFDGIFNDRIQNIDNIKGSGDEDVGEESDSTPSSGSKQDSVEINRPDKDASVAEAKPVGLAIAGEGGVASSKPVATAIVGPGGLAIARPIATAIAGITPSEVIGLGIPLANHKQTQSYIPLAGKYGLAKNSEAKGFGILVGPGFPAGQLHDNQNDALLNDDIPKNNENLSSEEISMLKNTQDVATDDPIEAETELAYTNNENIYSNNNGHKMVFPSEQISHAPESILPPQFPFVSPMMPGRFYWETEPVESAQGYRPLQFLDHRSLYPSQQLPVPVPVYPFMRHNYPYDIFNRY